MPTPDAEPRSFTISSERSAVLIRARSNVGPIEFGTTSITGTVTVRTSESLVVDAAGATARLEIDMATLSSGNSLYDAELSHRLDSRLYPTAVVELQRVTPLGGDNRYEVTGALTLHGVTTNVDGVVDASLAPAGHLVVSGDQVVDIRDFDIAAPSMLMLKIYPDVRVYLHLEADVNEGP